METLADKIIDFNASLDFRGSLPEGIRIMNPFRENEAVMDVSTAFYRKYYNDHAPRHLILGINPGRFGAGLTGIPFTDPKHLTEQCDIPYAGPRAHEPSSVFIYDMIRAFGGPEVFYRQFYISAVCPLGFTNLLSTNLSSTNLSSINLSSSEGHDSVSLQDQTIKDNESAFPIKKTLKGTAYALRLGGSLDGKLDSKVREVNYNYYDSKELTRCVSDFIVENLTTQLSLGLERNVCFCLGTGKNEKYLRELNNRYGFFEKIVALEHPRYIMQYKNKRKEEYIEKYLEAFSQVK